MNDYSIRPVSEINSKSNIKQSLFLFTKHFYEPNSVWQLFSISCQQVSSLSQILELIQPLVTITGTGCNRTGYFSPLNVSSLSYFQTTQKINRYRNCDPSLMGGLNNTKRIHLPSSTSPAIRAISDLPHSCATGYPEFPNFQSFTSRIYLNQVNVNKN